jgi:hypothetical protein
LFFASVSWVDSSPERIGETSLFFPGFLLRNLGSVPGTVCSTPLSVYFAFVFRVFLILLLSAIRFLAMNVGINASFETYV